MREGCSRSPDREGFNSTQSLSEPSLCPPHGHWARFSGPFARDQRQVAPLSVDSYVPMPVVMDSGRTVGGKQDARPSMHDQGGHIQQGGDPHEHDHAYNQYGAGPGAPDTVSGLAGHSGMLHSEGPTPRTRIASPHLRTAFHKLRHNLNM